MGECKTQMTEKKGEKKKDGWFKKKEKPEAAETFVDHLEACEATIAHLIDVKSKDVVSEGVSKAGENQTKLDILKAIQHNVSALQKMANVYAGQ